MNDPCLEAIQKSIELEKEIYNIKRFEGETKQTKALQKESNRLWAEAKELGSAYVSQANYDDLAAAIVRNAVEDYERLMSGTLKESGECNHLEIERFLRDQTYVQLDMPALLRMIARKYVEEFVPYANAYFKDINEEWSEFDKKRLSVEERVPLSKHRCPMCGGAMRPIHRYFDDAIGCTGCKLVYGKYKPIPAFARECCA